MTIKAITFNFLPNLIGKPYVDCIEQSTSVHFFIIEGHLRAKSRNRTIVMMEQPKNNNVTGRKINANEGSCLIP